MGLLDEIYNQGSTPPNPDASFGQLLSSPLAQGLLATVAGAAASYGHGRGLLGNLGNGGLTGLQAYSGAQTQRAQLAQDAKRNELLDVQTQAYKADVARKNDAVEAERRKRQALPSLFQQPGLTGGEAVPQTADGIPMFSQPLTVTPMKATPGGLNVQAALQAGYTPDEIAKLDGLRNVGLNKVARTVKATGPDGKEYEYQMDDYGRPVGQPLQQYRAPISVNQGNRTTFIEPYTLKPVQSLQTFQSPDSVASNAVQIRGQNMTDARSREQTAIGKVPAGYRQTADGSLEFIPGGPADPNVAKRAAPTEFQGKSTTFAARMQDAAKTIDALQSDVSPSQVAQAGYKPNFPDWVPGGQIVGSGIAAANKLITPEKAQQYRQAQENWVTANLRQESGAAIGKDEMEKDISKWFPQPGEPDSVIKQKAAARKVAERAMVVQAGPGANSIPEILGDSRAGPQPSAATGGADFKWDGAKLVRVKK